MKDPDNPDLSKLFYERGIGTRLFLLSMGINPKLHNVNDRRLYFWKPWPPGSERISRRQRLIARQNQAKSKHWKPLRKHRYIVPQKVWKKTYPINMRAGDIEGLDGTPIDLAGRIDVGWSPTERIGDMSEDKGQV